MALKLLLLILTLLVLNSSVHSLNRFEIDLYKYGFQHHDKRNHNPGKIKADLIEFVTMKPADPDSKTSNDPYETPRPPITRPNETPKHEGKKRAWENVDLMNLLQYLPREEWSESEPVIFLLDQFEDRPENNEIDTYSK